MKKLHNLDVSEVSLVSEGANKRRYIVYKGKGGTPMSVHKELHDMISKTDPEIMKNVDQLCDKHYSKKVKKADETQSEEHTQEGGQTADPTLPQDPEKVKAALKATARILAPFKEHLPAEVAHQLVDLIGFNGGATKNPNAEGDGAMGESGVEKNKAYPQEIEKAHHEEAMKSADDAYKERLKKLGYQKYPDAQLQMKSKSVHKKKGGSDADDDDEEEGEGDKVEKSNVAKSSDALDLSAFPKEQRPHLEAIFKSNQELVKKNADLEKELQTEKSERKLKEFVAKAAEFKHYVGDKTELAKELMELHEKSPALYEKVEKQLRAVDVEKEVVSKSLFRELGSNQGTAGASSAEGKIDAAVQSIVQKSAGAKTSAQAYADFIQTPEGQTLYAEYKSARKDGI